MTLLLIFLFSFSFPALNEVKVIVKVIDVNDNVPKFTFSGRPIIAALPSSANYGYQILKLHVSLYVSIMVHNISNETSGVVFVKVKGDIDCKRNL